MDTLSLINPVGDGGTAGSKMARAFSPKQMLDMPTLGYGVSGYYVFRFIHSAIKTMADKAGFQQARNDEEMDWKDWTANIVTAFLNIGLGRFAAQYLPGERQDSFMTGIYAAAVQTLVASPLAKQFPENRFAQYLGDSGDWGGAWNPTPDLPMADGSAYRTEDVPLAAVYYEDQSMDGDSTYNQTVLEEPEPFMSVGV